MGRPRLLDLFCCAGGASVGYHRAGFDVYGVDLVDRPRYPFVRCVGDALDLSTAWIGTFDLVHASPPCQNQAAITKGTNAHLRDQYPDLYPQTLALLQRSGVPFVIENPSARADLTLCGEMFGLGVLRHRRFELGGSWPLVMAPPHPAHRGRVGGWRHGVRHEGPYVAVYGDGGGKGTVAEWQAAMGIDWTDDRRELAEAIPPAYTEWIGRAFLAGGG